MRWLPLVKSILLYKRYEEKIADCNRKLEWAMSQFQVCSLRTNKPRTLHIQWQRIGYKPYYFGPATVRRCAET